MSPPLVPTLAELDIELQHALAALNEALVAEEADPSLAVANGASDQAASRIYDLSAQIEALPAFSMEGLRAKARALAYWQAGSTLETERWSNEESLSRQIVAGLLDERIAG